jgi:hypothetical protein
MASTPVNELERLLVAAATDPAARPEFYRQLLELPLFMIYEGKPERPGEFTADKNTSFEIRMLPIEGTAHAPLFTSAERLSAVAGQEAGYVSMKGRAALEMLRGGHLVINPGSDYAIALTPTNIDSILTGSIFQPQKTRTAKAGTKILLGQPNDYPHHITEALSRLFARSSHVSAAYLAHAIMPDTDPAGHTLIGLELGGGDYRAIVGEAGAVVREVCKPGEVVDFVQVTGNDQSIGTFLKQQTTPFYRRKKRFGIF